MAQDRYKRGLEKLKEIEGEAAKEVVQAMEGLSPDLSRYVIEYVYGDVYSRDGLSLKQKEIAAMGALIATGNAAPQLKSRMNGAHVRGRV
jgi:4-carboxymuconolactone decarboxylase